MNDNNFSAVIFPEGTRTRSGAPKKFATTGLKILLRNIPNGLVVPIVINNSWKLLKYKGFPMGLGFRISLEVLDPMEITDQKSDMDQFLGLVEERIKTHIKN